MQLLARREHPIYSGRKERLEINLLALDAGQPYVDARLSRFVAETQLSWDGGTRSDGTVVTGRRKQAHCIPYPGRIAEKVNQYVFKEPAERAGADENVVNDVTRNGCSVNQVMRDANTLVTACRWCWIGIDSPSVPTDESGAARSPTLLDVERGKLRPYWSLYSPLDVVDWKFSDVGTLLWLITQECAWECDDHLKPYAKVIYRNVWEPGRRTRYVIEDGEAKGMVEMPFPFPGVPFVPVGRPSGKNIVFDSLESINRTILDLESVSRQNYFDRCFPQAYLPASVLSSASKLFPNEEASKALQRVVGLAYPYLIEPGDVTPGYMQPNATDLSTIDKKVDQLKESMFECAGQMLRESTAQVASGVSKAWDFLDTASMLKDRALLLQDAERRAVEISAAWDPSGFPAYVPKYPTEFDVRDVESDIRALVMGMQSPMPIELGRELLEKMAYVFKRVGVETAPDKMKAILDAIAQWEGAAASMQAPGGEFLAPEVGQQQTEGVPQ
jgi:hypothetical protein